MYTTSAGAIVVILRVAALSDCMQSLAAHVNVGEDLPAAAGLDGAETTAAPELDPETEVVSAIDATGRRASAHQLAAEDAKPLHEDRVRAGARSRNSCGNAGGTATNNYNVI